jgi:hypothetical protein
MPMKWSSLISCERASTFSQPATTTWMKTWRAGRYHARFHIQNLALAPCGGEGGA